MLSAISLARHSIFWESYIIEDDVEPDFNFFETLTEKARSGVKVKIVLDGFGSFGLSGATRKKLTDSGVEICAFNSWFRRIHRKILIVDGRVAFMGGVNIGQKYKKWLDLQVRLTGKSIVGALTKSFARSYFYCGGADKSLLSIMKKSPLRTTELWLLEHFPFAGRLLLPRYYKEKIAQAKEKIVIVTPYFIPHNWLIRALSIASGRGVSVEIIMPAKTDLSFINFANHLFADITSKSGLKFFLTKDMIHAKVLLVDDKVGLVGSNNIDALSFDWNAEASVSFEEEEMIADLRTITELWKRDSIPLEHSHIKKPFYYKFLAFIVRLIQPIL
ncbi:MAG: phosphatidylserine/phosphatidylglycerophosphate/cardiolipin synthase family protein [Candidatus Vogelbacteria bacterium]|nr:phosphatidylserine/phosphatidylglycerophosphate/cardiolipin synthase family protein [Candidatus Vogelbacteria bacterium]